MKTAYQLIQYMFILLQSCFAGMLLGQVVAVHFYFPLQGGLTFLTAGVYVVLVFFLLRFKNAVADFFFRHVGFIRNYFLSASIQAAILLILVVPVLLNFEPGPLKVLGLQLFTCFAILLVTGTQHILEQGPLQQVQSTLTGQKKPPLLLSISVQLLAVASCIFLQVEVLAEPASGLAGLLRPALYAGSFIFLLLVAVKLFVFFRLRGSLLYGRVGAAQKEESSSLLWRLQSEFFFAERNLKKILTETDATERAAVYARIRQVPMVDRIEELSEIRELLLPDDGLASTIHFLKELKKTAEAYGPRFDIDTLSDIMEVKAYLRTGIMEGNILLVQKLLNDSRPEIKKAAIFATAYFREQGFIPVLVSHLKEPEYAWAARQVLYETGDSCIPFLRSAKYRNKENSFFIDQCLELAGQINTAEAGYFLGEMLNEPQKRIQYKAAQILLKKNFPVSALQKTRILHFVEDLIAVLAVEQEISGNIPSENIQLQEALKEEITEKRTLILDLLRAFVPVTVHHYLVELAAGESTENHYAVFALIDLFFPLVLRTKCRIIFGNSLPGEMAARLQGEYLNEQIHFAYADAGEAKLRILKMDYAQIGYWLRVCAIRELSQAPADQIPSQILAEVFNKNELLQETAAEILYDLNYDYYFLYMQRLSAERARVLKQKIELKRTGKEQLQFGVSPLLTQQIFFLKSLPVFQSCSYEKLAKHAHLFSLFSPAVEKGELKQDPYKAGGYWIVYQGSFSVSYKGERLVKAGRGEVVDMSFLIEAERNTVIIHPKNLLQVYFIEHSVLNNLYLTSGNSQSFIVQPKLDHSARPVLA